MKTLVILTTQKKIEEFSSHIEDITNVIDLEIEAKRDFTYEDIRVILDDEAIGEDEDDFKFLDEIINKEDELYVLLHKGENYFAQWKKKYPYPKANYKISSHLVTSGNPYYDFFKAIVGGNLTTDLIQKHFPTELEAALNFLHNIYNGQSIEKSLETLPEGLKKKV